MKASRAGTGGFRPPEVLLKSSKQDQKIDVWAAGVCLIIVLARRFVHLPLIIVIEQIILGTHIFLLLMTILHCRILLHCSAQLA